MKRAITKGVIFTPGARYLRNTKTGVVFPYSHDFLQNPDIIEYYPKYKKGELDSVLNTFTQYIPSYADMPSKRHPGTPFNTTEELLALDVVRRYKTESFHKWVMDDSYLMALTDKGRKWWVVGYIKYPAAIKLPKWDGGKRKEKSDDK